MLFTWAKKNEREEIEELINGFKIKIFIEREISFKKLGFFIRRYGIYIYIIYGF